MLEFDLPELDEPDELDLPELDELDELDLLLVELDFDELLELPLDPPELELE